MTLWMYLIQHLCVRGPLLPDLVRAYLWTCAFAMVPAPSCFIEHHLTHLNPDSLCSDLVMTSHSMFMCWEVIILLMSSHARPDMCHMSVCRIYFSSDLMIAKVVRETSAGEGFKAVAKELLLNRRDFVKAAKELRDEGGKGWGMGDLTIGLMILAVRPKGIEDLHRFRALYMPFPCCSLTGEGLSRLRGSFKTWGSRSGVLASVQTLQIS